MSSDVTSPPPTGGGDDLHPGLAASITVTVTADDTAVALGSGDVPVLGTPRVVALVEEASVAALEGHLQLEHTSVGAHIAMDHLRPTQVGAEVTAIASLTAVDGRRLAFDVAVREGEVEVARGTHRRVLVRRADFGG